MPPPPCCLVLSPLRSRSHALVTSEAVTSLSAGGFARVLVFSLPLPSQFRFASFRPTPPIRCFIICGAPGSVDSDTRAAGKDGPGSGLPLPGLRRVFDERHARDPQREHSDVSRGVRLREGGRTRCTSTHDALMGVMTIVIMMAFAWFVFFFFHDPKGAGVSGR